MRKTIYRGMVLYATVLVGAAGISVLAPFLKSLNGATAETFQNQEPEIPLTASRSGYEKNQSNPAEPLKAVPLAGEETAAFLDIRGVGDSGMALTYEQPLSLTQTLPQGEPANFGQRLDAFDSTGKSYRGDLSFINWETAVGTRCNRFRGTPSPSSYAFISHPDNLVEAYRRGFNLIGLANNHSRDCLVGENGAYGALESARYMERLSQQISANWLWHGVGPSQQKATAQVKTMVVKGKPIKVAFANLYQGGSCDYITCESDKSALLRSLRDVKADIRILSIHSWDSSTQEELVRTGRDFILNYKGDVVFGHGPHEWKPVTIIQSPSGKRGVMFESLGNFIHPNLAARGKDMIGRVLFELDTLELRQIQAIPLKVDGASANFKGALNPTSIPASNLTWKFVNDPSWQSGVSSQVRGVYYNLK